MKNFGEVKENSPTQGGGLFRRAQETSFENLEQDPFA